MKQCLKFGLIGALAGAAIGQFIILAISWMSGSYLPCSREMMELYGELQAVTLQFVICLILGFIFCCANQIWQTDWSLAKQTVIVYLIYVLTYLAAAWICFWTEHTLYAVLQIIVVFTVIFILIWLNIWIYIRKNLKEFNQKIQ